MSQGNPFNFNNIFGSESPIFGNKPSMEEQFKTIAEKNQIKVMQEKIDSLEAENKRLKELIIKCPQMRHKTKNPQNGLGVCKMNIVLSIKPKWAKLIYEGKKTVEWRKTLPSKMDLKLLRDGNPNVKVYLYETAPVKAITGFFYWGGTTCCDARNMTEDTKGLVPIKDLKAYQGERCSINAWHIDRPTKLFKKYSIQEFNLNRPPQSWCYTNRKITTLSRYREDKNLANGEPE